MWFISTYNTQTYFVPDVILILIIDFIMRWINGCRQRSIENGVTTGIMAISSVETTVMAIIRVIKATADMAVVKMAVMVAIMATDIYVKNALAKKGTALSWPQSRKYCTS